MLVPSQGAAKTIQGEVIRITGKVSNEILGNGGGNWDSDYKKMLDALLKHLGSGTHLDGPDLQEAVKLVKEIRGGNGDIELSRLQRAIRALGAKEPNTRCTASTRL